MLQLQLQTNDIRTETNDNHTDHKRRIGTAKFLVNSKPRNPGENHAPDPFVILYCFEIPFSFVSEIWHAILHRI